MKRFDPRVVLVAVLAALVHSGSLDGRFLEWDDEMLVSDNPRVVEGGLSDILDLLNPAASRQPYGLEYLPLRDLSNRVDRLFFGLNPVGYHLGNVLLFALAAAALYGVLFCLLGHRNAALAGALIFAVHPAATESVACIAHRKDVLMAALGITAWLAWLKDRPILAVVLFAGAALSKLPAIALPPLFLLADLARGRRLDARWFVAAGVLAAIAGGALAVSAWVAPALGGASWHGGTVATNALSVGVAFLESIRLLILPTGLHVGRVNEAMTRTSPDGASVAGLALLLALIVVGIVALIRQRRRPTTAGLVLVLSTAGLVLIQIPYLQIRPFWVLFAERYLVLALVPACLAAGWLIFRLPGRWPIAAGATILAVLAILTIRREADWKDTETLFLDAIEKEPKSYIALDKVARLRLIVANKKSREGRLETAKSLYLEAVALFRRSVAAAEEYRPVGQALLEEILVKSRQDLINALLDMGRMPEARVEAEIWGRGWPDSHLARFFLGLVAHKEGRPAVAEPLYLESLEMAKALGVTLHMADYNLSLIYRDLDGPLSERSLLHLRRSVETEPGFVQGWLELAGRSEQAGRWEDVAEALRQVVAADPGNRDMLLRLAQILERRLGLREEAREYRRRAARLR